MPTLLGLSVMLPALFGTVLVQHPNVLTQPSGPPFGCAESAD